MFNIRKRNKKSKRNEGLNYLRKSDYTFYKQTLTMLDERWGQYLAGNTRTYTLEESMQRINAAIAKQQILNGLRDAVEEVKQIEAGEKKAIPLKDFLRQL